VGFIAIITMRGAVEACDVGGKVLPRWEFNGCDNAVVQHHSARHLPHPTHHNSCAMPRYLDNMARIDDG
jgi:hypothetical protein